MKTAIIPCPAKLEELKGIVSRNTPVTKQICPQLDDEAYRLSIMPDGICIEGGSDQAIIYGKTTLEQIYQQHDDAIPCLAIEDKPAYAWRAFHIDCARHFIQIDVLKKMIRMAAFYKLNKFHWHFSDDQGWRIECLAFPRLHEIGSVRKGDHFGQYDADEEEGGYYTREQVKDIVAYCASLGIEVVPEVDMPGHVTAILAAYPNLSCRGKQVEVGNKAGIFREILCVGQEETFDFIERLLKDLMELFPGKFIHIGGDETPKTRWGECPRCQQRMKDEGISSLQELQGYMENRVIAYLTEHGRTAIVWNEAANGGNLDSRAYIQLWTEDKEKAVARHIVQGGKVILSNMMNCYCDYPYGFISLKSVYELDLKPQELTDSIDEALLREESPIAGSECLIWTEYVRDSEKLEELCWPRFTASAEIGWCGAARPGYDDFTQRLQILFPVFEKLGIYATGEKGWIPSEEETLRQLEEFKKNFKQEDMEEFREAQTEI